MYCSNCGTRLDDGAVECFNCGTRVESAGGETESAVQNEKKVDYNKEFDKLKTIAVESAGKAIQGAQQLANQAAQKVEERKTEMKLQAERQAQEEEARKKEMQLQLEQHRQRQVQNEAASGSRYMSSTELWSWLKQSGKRQMYYTEDVSEVTEDEFMGKITNKIQETGVPAVIERRGIQWDRSNVHNTSYFIKPYANVVNPLSCLIQFNHVGKFTFVEEKTFITPPDLPPVPNRPKPLDQGAAALGKMLSTYGAIALAAGLLLMMLMREKEVAVGVLIAGGILLWAGNYFKSKNKEIEEYNKECERQEQAWADAWTNWQNSIFLHSFQEDINGQLSRVYDAVFECIKQVSAEEFAATKVVEQEESSNINELEELIARRKEEYR